MTFVEFILHVAQNQRGFPHTSLPQQDYFEVVRSAGRFCQCSGHGLFLLSSGGEFSEKLGFVKEKFGLGDAAIWKIPFFRRKIFLGLT
jgi:hypothetical protein